MVTMVAVPIDKNYKGLQKSVMTNLQKPNDQLFTYNALICSVYDGDTCRADVDLGFGVWAINAKIRLLGINAPEIRSKDPIEKKRAKESREYLCKKVLGKRVIIKSKGKGKYGRWLCMIYYPDVEKNEWVNVNQELVKEKHAKPYLA